MQRAEKDGSAGPMVLPREELTPDLCVIGAGSGGLSVAAAAAAFGRSVVLIEKHKMGGDCLNYGCVPSKALIAAARRAHAVRTASRFGIKGAVPDVDFAAVRAHIAEVIAEIAPNDSAERFTGLGVRVVHAAARFVDKRTVVAGEYRIRARRFVIATGSAPAVPPIPGLDQVPYLTNETIFDNAAPIPHLIVIGGGPIGLEIAHAYRRLGSEVTVIEAQKALAKDDPEMAAVVLSVVRAEGVVIREGAKVQKVAPADGSVDVTIDSAVGSETVRGSHLLVAAGRRPILEGLGLDEAGVAFTRTGITVDRGLGTTNPRVYAIGDCVGGLQFTHVANYHAGIVIRRALFRLPAKVDQRAVPWVTYTDPELAHVGLTEAAAAAEGLKPRVLRWTFRENDRAVAERETIGHIKVVVDGKGHVLGASIVGAEAGEIVQMWALAIAKRLKIKAMTDWISPYPTRSEVSKRAAYRYFAAAPANPIVRKVVGLLARLG